MHAINTGITGGPDEAALLEDDPIQLEQTQRWTRRPGAMGELCRALVRGLSLSKWVRLRRFDHHTVFCWIQSDPGRAGQYAQVEQIVAGQAADELRDLAAELRQDASDEEPGAPNAFRNRRQRTRLRIAALNGCVRRSPARSPGPRTRSEPVSREMVKDTLRQLFEEGWEPENAAGENTLPPSSGPSPRQSSPPSGNPPSQKPPAPSTSALNPSEAPTKAPQMNPATQAPQAGPTPSAPRNPPEPDAGAPAPAPERPPAPSKPACTKLIGRNESCPCGSGKKFKKCCG